MSDVVSNTKRSRYKKKLPIEDDVREALVYHSQHGGGVHMHIAFGLWQSMVEQAIGVKLYRHHFEEALESWEEDPQAHTLMTMVINAEDQHTRIIAAMKPAKDRVKRPQNIDGSVATIREAA